MALGGVLLAASALVSSGSQAAGLGKLSVNSALGQPLVAEIELVSLQPGEFEALVARVASPEAYTDAKVEYSPLLRQLTFTAERRADGKPVLKITSFAPINEPFLDVLVEMNWPAGRLLREYPILLDPPGFNQARVSPPSAPVVAKVTAAPANSASSATTAVPINTPAVVAAPSAKAESSPDAYGPVKRGDTLSKIASSMKADGISLEQMLVALYRENKSAFINNNMNQLKTGQILRVPSAAEVGKIAKGEAQREVKVQVADWKGYRDQVASAVASSPNATASANKAASNEASGKIATAKPAPLTPAATATDQLKIAKTEVTTGKSGSAAGAAVGGKNATQEQLNAMKEDAIAKDNKLKEANSRVADLEKQIADMRQLMTLKGVAAPGKPGDPKVEPAKVAQVTSPAAVPTPPPAAPVAAKPVEPPKVEVAKVDPAAATKPVDPTKPADAAKVEPPKVVPVVPATATPPSATPPVAAKTPAKAPVAPPPEPGIMDVIEENAVAIVAGIIGLIGVGGLLAFMSRRKKKPKGGSNTSQLANTSSIMPSDLKPNSVTGSRGGGLVDTGNSSFLTDFDKTGPGSIDTDEVDPVAEAEVYIAYGRDAQAEEILKEAMTRDKSRHEIAFKLLEIYHTRKSVQAFETVARELKETAGADHPLWAKAAALGASIDPSNNLYGGTGQAFAPTGTYVAAGGALAAGTAALAAGAAGAADHAAPPDLDFDLGFSDSPSGSASEASIDIAALKTGEQAASSMDFDLDLNPASGSAPKPAADAGGLDFDLAFDSSATAPVAPAASSGAVEVAPTAASGFDFDLSALSFDEPAHEPPAAVPSLAAAAPSQEQFAATIATQSAAAPVAPAASAGLSFGDLSLDLADSHDLGSPASSASSGSSGGANAATTKLELAKAYIEIGDSDGAKEILAEVAREGNAAQQDEAKKILAGI